MSQSVFISRHGQRIDRVVKDWKSLPNSPGQLHLSPHGIEQAKALGRRLRSEGVGRIFVSPFWRTIETAQHVAEQIDVPVCVEYGVCEYLQPKHFPNGLIPRTAEEMKPHFDRIDTSYTTLLHPEGPEDEQRITERTARAINALLEQERDNFLIITHAMSARLMACALLGESREGLRTGIECAVTQLARQGETWELVHDGDEAHLPEDTQVHVKGPSVAQQLAAAKAAEKEREGA
jgi:broad specificity phosphatase PhoE